MPTIATLVPGPTPSLFSGEYRVMPAQSSGAAASSGIESGMRQT